MPPPKRCATHNCGHYVIRSTGDEFCVRCHDKGIMEKYGTDIEPDDPVKCSTPQCNELAYPPYDKCLACDPTELPEAARDPMEPSTGGNTYVPPDVIQDGDIIDPQPIGAADALPFDLGSGAIPMTGKDSKVRLELVDFDFIIEMAKVFQAGLRETEGRNANDWQRLDSEAVASEYRGALLRHYAAGEWASVAVNAAILWWHERKLKRASQ